jgi:hypothetical protein
MILGYDYWVKTRIGFTEGEYNIQKSELWQERWGWLSWECFFNTYYKNQL